MTARERDALASERKLSLGDFKAAIPPECLQISPARAWSGLLENLVVLAVCTWAVHLMLQLLPAGAPLWATVLLYAALAPMMLVLALGYVGLFVIGHDCGHGSFSKKRWVNDVVGHVLTGVSALSFEGWRLGHGFHHAHVQKKGIDPDWPEGLLSIEEYEQLSLPRKIGYRIAYGSPVGLLVGIWVGHTRRNLLRWLYPQVKCTPGQWRRVLIGNVTALLVPLAIMAAVHALGGWPLLMVGYVIPMLIGGALGTFLTFLHHSNPDSLVFDEDGWTPVRGQVISTYDVRFPAWVERLWKRINIHLAHHVATRIPWYHLPRATTALSQRYPEFHQELPFHLGLLTGFWQRSWLRRDERARFYEMSSLDAPAHVPAPGPAPVADRGELTVG
jgi:omega-6 fatty acid desaturase (delta-12 desaturase)